MLTSFIVKNNNESFNGYVALPKDHNGYKFEYDDQFFADIDVHGGLTYSCSIEETEEMFPHIYKEYLKQPNTSEEDEVRIVGFDTMHLGDTKDQRDEVSTMAETDWLRRQLEDM